MMNAKATTVKDWEDALALGYRVSKPGRQNKKLEDLCGRLGPEYHLASIDFSNVIHRVIGGGWSLEIFPENRSHMKYIVSVMRDYGRTPVMMQREVPDVDDGIRCMAEMLLQIHVPESVYPVENNIVPRTDQ